jgi:hypothetical protein
LPASERVNHASEPHFNPSAPIIPMYRSVAKHHLIYTHYTTPQYRQTCGIKYIQRLSFRTSGSSL